MKTVLAGFGALAASVTLTAPPAYAGPNPYLGEVFFFAGSFCPRGTLPTDGRLLPIAQNKALFTILGTRYGGDGRTTFALPKLEAADRNKVDVRGCIAVEGVYPSRP